MEETDLALDGLVKTRALLDLELRPGGNGHIIEYAVDNDPGVLLED